MAKLKWVGFIHGFMKWTEIVESDIRGEWSACLSHARKYIDLDPLWQGPGTNQRFIARK